MCERKRGLNQNTHISEWEHSSHFRLIGRGVPSVSFIPQLAYDSLCLSSPREQSPDPNMRSGGWSGRSSTPSEPMSA